MNVKLIQGAVGENFSFLPRQIVSCPKAIGEDLIRGRIAVKAPDNAEVDGEWPVLDADQKAEAKKAAQKKYEKMGLKAPKVEQLLNRRATIEKAIKRPSPETPEKGTGETDPTTCTGQTKAGNPCGKAPVEGTDRCANHPHEA